MDTLKEMKELMMQQFRSVSNFDNVIHALESDIIPNNSDYKIAYLKSYKAFRENSLNSLGIKMSVEEGLLWNKLFEETLKEDAGDCNQGSFFL